MFPTKTQLVASMVATLCTFPVPSSATLVGTSIVANAKILDWVLPTDPSVLPILTNAVATVVDPGVEYSTGIDALGGSSFTIDVLGNKTFRVTADYADLGIFPSDWVVALSSLNDDTGAINNVTRTDSNDPNFLSGISFTGDSISVFSPVGNLFFGSSVFAEFSYTTSDGGSVPEPSGFALLGIALAGIGASKMRSKRMS